ncbi:MAG TPA: M14 metallopeptidase family protein [Bryobacteraceae bacterium]|nr:M14 metallopeptidase family protein [Bryobacteraceae bacterium]
MNFPLLRPRLLLFTLLFLPAFISAQPSPKITTPKEFLGFNIGDDYMMASYTNLEAYWKKIASECDRCKLVDIGPTEEGRRQYMMIISSPANMKKLDHYKEISSRLAHAEGLTDDQAHALAREGKAVVWIDGGLHASETVGSQQLMESVYQMASRTDPETMRFLDDVIGLYVLANPDGQEFCANWYMREKDPLKRSLNGLPRLYAKYVGHDDNRDFYMSAMKETTNMNRQLFLEWFPEIMYNHHQTGPAGAVIFMPPFRDPFNYNFDPLIPLGIEMVGTAMHSRLVAEGKGGSAMRTGANYSTWWNGGLRTVTYFHNMIGILTEIIGNPTPIDIALVPEKQLPQGDWPLPIAPTTNGQKWHYRQSIDYEITNNRAILDLASRYRETFLYNIYQMGRNSIEKGNHDTWTTTPKRIEAMEAAAAKMAPAGGRGGRGGRGATEANPDLPGGLGARTLPSELYNTVLHDPKMRDPRGYIIPADQADFATATEFVDALLKNGITVMKATSSFAVAGKNYPSGSYVVKTAQAFRPHIMDMFEPQDHPNDFAYPGGPPKPPYDITGWTLAYQMGVQFDRILDGFDGPFTKVAGLLPPPPSSIMGTGTAGYLISHKINNSFVLINRLLKAGADVYWLKKNESADGRELGTGTIWVPANSAARPILEQTARQFGVPVYAVAKAPTGDALKLKPIRIGLVDQYGGLMPSGWTRWLFENYEFPFEVVYPQTLDAGELKSKFDVLVFVDGAFRRAGATGRGGLGALFGGAIDPESVPAEYRPSMGRVSEDKTMAQLKKFVESGGSIVTIGSSTGMGELLGLPVKNYLTEKGPDGHDRALPREKFFIPGSLLKTNIDNTNPLAYGMPSQVDVFFDNSPVFRMEPNAEQRRTSAVAWYSGATPLDSGWAWGQQYLDGGTAVAEASIGEGKVFLLGPEVAFRSQPHATYKLLFNGLYFGSAKETPLK